MSFIISDLIYICLLIGFSLVIFLWRNKKGTAKDRLKNGKEYIVIESFKSDIEPSSFLLKLGDGSTSSLYLIESYKIRDGYLKIISQDNFPKVFKVKKLKTLLPDRFPSYIKAEVYILVSVPAAKENA